MTRRKHFAAVFVLAAIAALAAGGIPVFADGPSPTSPQPDSDRVVGQWSVTGPYGGSVRALAIAPDDPNRIYIATSDGQLYRSRDGGRTWSRTIPGFDRPGLVIDNLAIDHENPAVMYIGVWAIESDQKGGMYKSTDGGDTWKELPGMRDRSVRAIAFGPNDSKLLVVGALDGVYRSTDAGESWDRISPKGHPEIRNIESVAIDPRDPSSIYVGTWHLPWKTSDGGANWFSVKQGILDDSDIFSIAIVHDTPDQVFASACSGIYMSQDSGANWSKVQGIPFTSRRTRIIYPHPTRPGTVFAGTTQGLWRTLDGGKTWQLMTTKSLVVNDIEIYPGAPDTVVLGTDNHGVLISTDLGQNFVESNVGFIHRQVLSILPDAGEPGRIYSTVFGDGVAGGFFVSTDGGKSWRQSIRGLGGRDVFSVYQEPDAPATLYAGTSYGVYRSTDRGGSWAFVGKATPKPKVKAEGDSDTPAAPKKKKATRRGLWPAPELEAAEAALAQKKTTPAKPAAKTPARAAAQSSKTASKSPAKTPAKGAAVAQSRKTKKPAGPTLITLEVQVNHFDRYVDAEGKKWLLAAAATGLYRTQNPDKGWELMKTEGLMPPYITVSTAENDPEHTMYLGTSKGLAISHDYGATWETVGRGPDDESVKSIVQDPRDPATVYVGCRGAFFKTTDGGRSWRKRGGGLPAGDITVVALDPRDPDVVYAADYLVGGVYRSNDKAESWKRLDSGLPSSRVWALAPDPFDPGRIYAGSFSGGVYVFTTTSESARAEN